MPISIANLKEPDPVKYFCALTFADGDHYRESVAHLVQRYGSIEFQTAPAAFSHTAYYAAEMGDDLRKAFVCFEKLYPIDCFVDYKLLSLRLETRYAVHGKRTVNIDPGYLELAKLVLASTKNFDHRVYLGQKIYGDVQLRFRGGKFVANEWTYPDYRQQASLDFFARVRRAYLNQLRENNG
jgi:hypothetical protein